MKKFLVFSVLFCMLFVAGCSPLIDIQTSSASNNIQADNTQASQATQASQCSHNWEPASCTEASKCILCGQTTGEALGHRYSNGYCVRCDQKDPDYKAYGSLEGSITYKYNDFVGNRGDTGAKVILISKDVESLPDRLGLGMMSENPDGVYNTEVDGTGSFRFDHIPAGEYYIVIISKNTNENPDRVSGYRTWGADVMNMFSEKGQENALLTAKTHKIRNDEITIYDQETSSFSYDFGTTYI